jgi:hypothetical protein
LELETIEQLRGEASMAWEESSRRAFQCRSEFDSEIESLREQLLVEERNAAEWYKTAEMACNDRAELQEALNQQFHSSQVAQCALESHKAEQDRIDEAKRVMINSAMQEQEQTLRREYMVEEAASHSRYEEAIRELQICADQHQEQRLQLDEANRSRTFFEQRAASVEMELHQQLQDLSHQEQQICDFGRAELMAMTEEQEMRLMSRAEEQSRERTEQLIADAVTSADKENKVELAQCRGRHAAAMAAVHGEYSGEIAALRHLELTSRDELANARLACEAAEAAAEETAKLEGEKAQRARCALHEEKVSSREYREKLHCDLQEKLLSELWPECYTEAQNDIFEDVRINPCSQLRKELIRDLKTELADQVRAELRSELLTSTGKRNDGSPASSVSMRLRQQRTHSATVGSTSASGIGISPSSIGACSAGESSPDYASSYLLIPGPHSPSQWPEAGDSTCRDSKIWTALTAEIDDHASSRKPPDVSSAPLSRQSSISVLDLAAPAPSMARSFGARQWTPPSKEWTPPSKAPKIKLDGGLPSTQAAGRF